MNAEKKSFTAARGEKKKNGIDDESYIAVERHKQPTSFYFSLI